MLLMILKLALATCIYIAVTVLLWHFWHKHEEHTLTQKLAIGLFYGLCSVISSHIGIDYGDMVLNVRDLGPLAAGLFFDPLAGILSGLIGGIERFIIGQYFNIGAFTRVACSISTILAGLLSAFLNRWIYRGERPSAINCLFVGAEMEVFHMYAVFITNRNDMPMASRVVGTVALPMIAFTGAGLAACSLILARMSGSGIKARLSAPKRDTPLDVRFQRWLLVVIVFSFAVNFAVGYSLQTRIARNDAYTELQDQQSRYAADYGGTSDLKQIKAELDQQNLSTDLKYVLVDTEKALQVICVHGGEISMPADSQEVGLIVENAGGNPFETRLKQWPNENFTCVSVKLAPPWCLLIAMPDSVVYATRHTELMETLFLEILIFTSLYLLIGVLVNKLVVRNLERVNKSLTRITDGHLTEVVTVEESSEFSKLSEDINKTVTSLRELIDASEKRMEEELKLAAEIQDSALPKNFNLPSANIELYALMTPARQVGGDFYDFFHISSDQLVLVIADVSGKGIPGAMFMMRAKTAIKNCATGGISPATLLENVNRSLCEGNDAEMFVTVWLGILDLKTGLMRCANAGHEYPALMRAGGDYELLKDKHGLVLGAMEGIRMKEYEIQLEPGDRLFVYTDGVPEAFSEEKQQYGTKRITEQLNALKGGSQKQILTGMLEDIRRFAGDEEQFDDITMVGITYKAPV